MKRDNQLFNESRGISTTIGYTGLLAITAILLAVIIGGGHSIVSGQTDIVATDQLEANGATLSDEITTVRRMATKPTDTNTNLVSTVELPDRTVEGQYLIDVDGGEISLTTTTSDISVVTPLPSTKSGMTVESDGRLDGGTVEICYSGGDTISVKKSCSAPAPFDPNTALAPAGDFGDPVRDSGNDYLIFRIENIGSEQATVEKFSVDASDLNASMEVDDGNADEVEIRRVTQEGNANRDGSPDVFDATGTQYDFVTDSTTAGEYAKIDPGTNDAEVDIRSFSQDIPELEFTESATDADLTVTLVLESGNKEVFHFKKQ